MNAWIYSLGMHLLALLAALASPFNEKLKLGIVGRKMTFKNLSSWRNGLAPTEFVVWFHCASLGEFEQGRPVIEELKRVNPEIKIALTFFSPSGYEVRKNYSGADWVGYLPFDTPRNAQKFIQLLSPQAAAIVKYEFWANYFFELKKRNIPLISFSSIFQPNQRFFKSNNHFWRSVLECVQFYFVQDEISGELLRQLNIENFEVTGDTRFDRVSEIASQVKPLDWLTTFKGNNTLVVIGSSYAEEEKWAKTWLEKDEKIRVCIVPHDVDDARISETISRFENYEIVRYSELASKSAQRVLVVDKIGLLSNIYSQANFVILGGGFNNGIHNSLEAAVFDVPLFFGPKYQKFKEAKDLIALGAAQSGTTSEEMYTYFNSFLNSPRASGGKNYVDKNTGASKIICAYLLSCLPKN